MPGLGLIGAGAFGAFCLPFLRDHFDVAISDPSAGLDALARGHRVAAASLADVAGRDIVLIAVPWRALAQVASEIAPHLKPGAIVVEVCSIKVKPLAILREMLPDYVEIVGTHPLFGPQSGRNGIAGRRIAVCEVAGNERAARHVARFLKAGLDLDVVRATPQDHDRQMATVQGLTHFVARTIAALDLPTPELTTTTFDHLMRMVETVRHDADDLYRTITEDNPYAGEIRERFLAEAERHGTRQE